MNDYANYLESELGEEHIIRSLPNGSKDEISVSEGKLVKRVSDDRVGSVDWFYAGYTNIDVARISNIIGNINKEKPIRVNGQIYQYQLSDSDSISSQFTWRFQDISTNDYRVVIKVPKNTYVEN